MKNKSIIEKAFRDGKAFLPFITCGYPTLDITKDAIRAAIHGGADIIELGIPFPTRPPKALSSKAPMPPH